MYLLVNQSLAKTNEQHISKSRISREQVVNFSRGPGASIVIFKSSVVIFLFYSQTLN